MKVRIEGLENEIPFLIAYLKQRYPNLTKSRLYKNRDGKNYRCYVELGGYFTPTKLSSLEQEDLEANPLPWDAVLGGQDEQKDSL